jgi:hypothetical protein
MESPHEIQKHGGNPMITPRLTDLDELTLTVRDPTSRAYIAEALAAYRAAIVSTWIAVVRQYRPHTAHRVFIWSLDHHLSACDRHP